MTNVEVKGTYQSLEINDKLNFDDEDRPKQGLSKEKICLIAFFSLATLVFIFFIVMLVKDDSIPPKIRGNIDPSSIKCPSTPANNRWVSVDVAKSNSDNSNYCKTSCDNPCATYESVYGELCCDWEQTNGGETCSIFVDENGICRCNGNQGSVTYSSPYPSPYPSEINSGSAGTPAPMHWFDDDWWAPSPPWNPIPSGQPPGSTPCLTKCKHSCGQSQTNGKSYCCESTPDGSCHMTTSNGQCYCGGGDNSSPTPSSNLKSSPHSQPQPESPTRFFNDDFFNQDDEKSSNPPEGSTPCKTSCKHACGQSQDNGKSYCCESSSDGSCKMSNYNGQCYCG